MTVSIGNSNLIDTWATTGNAVDPGISKTAQGWLLGEEPPHEFENYLQKTQEEKINHVLKNGIPLWSSTTAYDPGNIVSFGLKTWVSNTSHTNSQPALGSANWNTLTTSPSVTALKSTSQIIVPSVFTTITFNSIDHDDRSMWTIGQPTRLTVPTGATRAQLQGNIGFIPINGGERVLARIRKNNLITPGTPRGTVITDIAGSKQNSINLASGFITVIPGDYFEMNVLNEGTANIDIGQNAEAQDATWLSMSVEQ